MDRGDDRREGKSGPRLLTGFILPLAVLVVFVAIVSGLVLGGVVQGHAPRGGPGQVPTTRPTVEIAP